jgi:hypothetical protein
MRLLQAPLLMIFLLCFAEAVSAWPIDGYPDTGIRRLEADRLVLAGELEGTRPLPGARWTTGEVDLRLLDRPGFGLPEPDADLTAAVAELLGEQAEHYGLALLDLSDPDQAAYAEHRADLRQNVGSVGKLLAALGFLQALADAQPDTARREAVLRNTVVTADRFSQKDHHDVRLFDVATRQLATRVLAEGDTGSAWEYLDWALSVSSNAAAAMVMRDAMLLRQFGAAYPVPEQSITPFFDGLPAAERTRLFQATFWEPVTRNGLALDQIRQGSFFSRGGKRVVSGGGLSYATPRSLLQLLVLMEQGKLVDEWSSRVLKRLIYLTERRIRYASSPALRDAAVYFKSGSLYSCQPEEGYRCGKYRGNKRNFMNSVAIVEANVDGRRLHYITVLVSNVLKENSAVAHQSIATGVHELVRRRHGS